MLQGGACWACGKGDSWGHHFEVAHILGAAHRTDHEWNLAWLGHSCHASNHGRRVIVNGHGPAVEKLTLANMLFLKALNDPENYDLPALLALHQRPLPDPEPPEGWIGRCVRVDR